MGRETKRLKEALLLKEETKGFLTNLEKLKRKGTVEQEQYDSIKADYQERLKAATSEITEIKVQLSQQLENEKKDRDNHKLELGNLETRFKVGELSLDSYQGQERKIKRKIEKIEEGMAELQRLIKAKSASDVSEYADVPAPKKSKAPSTTRSRTRTKTRVSPRITFTEFISSAEEITTPKTKVVGMIGGLLLFISVFLNWKSTGEYFGVSAGISGSEVSGAITAFGIICGLVCIGTALLAQPRARGVLYMLAGALSMLIFLVVWFSSSILALFEVVREGVFFYILPVIAIFIAGVVDFRRE